MSVNRAVLVACAVIATTVAVRSQSTAPSPVSASGTFPANVAPASPPPTITLPDGAHPATAQAGAPPVDLSALRYFASQNDPARVAAEIKLLRAKNPDWEPPEELSAGAMGGIDEQPLWDLFAKHDLVGLHAKMDDIRRGIPDWKPSSDLAGKLALAEAHDALVKASDAKQWSSVIDIANGTRMLLTCGDVDALWRTAEALARAGDEARAFEAYRYVMATCQAPGARLATAQKASGVLQSADALDALLQMGTRGPDGRGEFDEVRLDRFRRRIGEAAADPAGTQPTQAEIDAVAAIARTPAGRPDAQLLGWYCYARKDYAGAQRWFRSVLDAGTDTKAAEGLVLTLRAAGDIDGARSAAIQYQGLDVLNRKLMVEVVSTSLTDPNAKPLTAEDMTVLANAVDALKSQDGAQAMEFYASSKNDAAGTRTWSQKSMLWKGEEIEELKSAEAAEALGWQYYQADDVANADVWFRKSADWKSNEGAAVGLVVTARRLHHDRDYAARIAEFSPLFARVAELEKTMRPHSPTGGAKKVADGGGHSAKPSRLREARRQPSPSAGGQWDRSADDIVKAFGDGKYDAAVAMLDQRRSKRVEPRGLSIVRGWAMYQKGDWEGAKQVFSSLPYDPSSRDREEGLRVIQSVSTPTHVR